MDKNPSNTHTSAYYKARKRLTEASVKGLMCQSGTNLDKASSDSWLCHHRRVLLTDANFKKLLSAGSPASSKGGYSLREKWLPKA